ncbi:transglutaminase domain-containing protein [Flavobacterium cellulosilyticum]|uniref:Transglutaminase domain-containing protein n=1 Tax=Flavobacterium cellulosilyticum TaxID=2541731 RepID=A0A4R5CK29_9FLAO|nr:transglutaminase domain-containing protein [Flavobacterium cellulosilyticum]TDD98713.1 transglutaminase domain-containing protein [Flavobacterium cellulosilyticum]
MIKLLIWYLRRHPLLYKIRFRLVSKNSSIDSIENYCYNDLNTKTNIPHLFFEVNNLIFNDSNKNLSDFEKTKKIAIWLRNNIKGGPGLGKSSEKALDIMIKGNGGVCSDFSQIYNNFCVINDLKVKEWGVKNISKDQSVSGGHSFNEVYINEFRKWIMIDIAKSIVFYHNDKNIPLSALEFIKLKKENKEIFIYSVDKNILINDNHLKNIFLTSSSVPFLITNYSNKIYDYTLNNLAFFPESIIHGILFIIGKSYTFEFPKMLI